MTNDELRELDAWIAEHVMGEPAMPCLHLKAVKVNPKFTNLIRCPDCGMEFGDTSFAMEMARFRSYTTSPADAMRVLCECHKRLGPLATMTSYQPEVGGYWIRAVPEHGKHIEGIAETFELAAVLFARKVFSK